jgi:hypothetical protein
MGLKEKGSRAIQIGSDSYRWTLSKSSQAANGCISIIIELAEQRGQRIVVLTPCRDFWLDFSDLRDNPPLPPKDPYRPVTPAMVEKIIKAALDAGWTPRTRQKNLNFEWTNRTLIST